MCSCAEAIENNRSGATLISHAEARHGQRSNYMANKTVNNEKCQYTWQMCVQCMCMDERVNGWTGACVYMKKKNGWQLR